MSFSFLFFAILLICECKSNDQAVQKIVKANEKFTADVYKELIKTENDNIIFSGLSAETVLSLVSDGAKGDTQTELLTALGLPNNQQLRDEGFKQLTKSLNINTDKLRLLSANKIYPGLGNSILESFNKTAVDVYNAGVQTLDYRDKETAAKVINDWVADRTLNKIQNLIDPSLLSPATLMVLVNALYFSGDWVHPFEEYNTKKRIFYKSDNESEEIDTMYTEANVKYGRCNYLKAKFLELDFKGGNISMVFVLPNSRSGLKWVEENIEEYLPPQRLTSARVAITLPKFTINTKIDFKPILQALGVKKAFTNSADLTGIAKKQLKIDFIIQKAIVEVTESGVVAAAATAVGLFKSTAIEEPVKVYSFKADHPFFYYIRDNDLGAVLFAGRFGG